MKKAIAIFLALLRFEVNANAQSYFEPIGTGQGLTGSLNCGVQTLGSSGANHLLYMLGNFQKADGVIYNGTCVWNGTDYDSLLNLGSVPSGALKTASWDDTTVITWNNSIRLMNGTQFLQFLPSTQSSFGVSGLIYSVCVLNHELYIGGDFKVAGSTTVNNIAKWNGTDWESVGGGITGSTPLTSYIGCLGIYNGDLIASGYFDSIGGVGAKNIARWDGLLWHDMGGGVDQTSNDGTHITAIKEFNGDLFITGGVHKVGSISCTGFAKWDGVNWGITQSTADLGDGTDLELYNNELFISGWIFNPPFHGALAKYENDSIIIFQNNSLAHIYNMEVFDSFLYVGGSFDTLGGVYCNRIARFYEDSATGFHEVPFTNNKISIYPNPANESVTFTWDAEASEMELADLLGRVVLKQSVTPVERSKKIDLLNLSSGIYFLTVKTKQGRESIKVIKE